MARVRTVTELEGMVLGVIRSRQPCTPYQVRKEFLDSPSPYWSGSAGAIYPVVTRLETAGFVRSRDHATGSRRGRHYRVTSRGQAALARWIGPPVTEEITGVPPDPLRMRIALLDALPPAARLRFLEETEARIRESLGEAQRYHDRRKVDGPMMELMARGALAMQRTRLRWIREVAEALR
jgi:DNA-binding PadR family transcriptional regulator